MHFWLYLSLLSWGSGKDNSPWLIGDSYWVPSHVMSRIRWWNRGKRNARFENKSTVMGTQVCERVGSLPFASGALFSSPRMLLFSPLAAQFFSLPIILHQACSHDALANHSSVSQSSLSAWQVKFCGAWSFYIWGQCALAFSGCQNKAPQTGCLKQQKCIVSQFPTPLALWSGISHHLYPRGNVGSAGRPGSSSQALLLHQNHLFVCTKGSVFEK